jgi:uncharacterized BrkB/YihY/UPF0761 family membrane protein
MSTAAAVPTTHDLEGDDAIETLRSVGLRELARDALLRFRLADGFSHARALAFQITLTLLPAVIAVVGLARVLDQRDFSHVLTQTIQDLATCSRDPTNRSREPYTASERALCVGRCVGQRQSVRK